jgi:hypothetical protein
MSMSDEMRAQRNTRASERERERRSVEALQHLGLEIAELVDLRGLPVATAGENGLRHRDTAALDALEGRS